MLAFRREDGEVVHSGIGTNLLQWPSGLEAAPVLVDHQFAVEHLRALCEMPDQSRNLDMPPALPPSAVASLPLSLSQTCVR